MCENLLVFLVCFVFLFLFWSFVKEGERKRNRDLVSFKKVTFESSKTRHIKSQMLPIFALKVIILCQCLDKG